MKFIKEINQFRRTLTKGLTRFLLKSNVLDQSLNLNPELVTRVLISRPNHRLGNQLLITPLVQEVQLYFPNAKIDLFVKGGVAHVIFENYPQVNKIIQLPKKHFSEFFQYLKGWYSLRSSKYDLAFNVEQSSSSGRLSIKFSNAKIKLYGDLAYKDLILNQFPDAKHNAKFPVYVFRKYLEDLKVKPFRKDIYPLDLKLSTTEIDLGKAELESLNIDHQKPTIALFTYATGSKCYDPSWWASFLKLLKAEFQNQYNLIEILPVENVSQINFELPSYYSKDIRAIGGLMNQTSVFIGADSGMMHLSSASQVTTVGLFSVTDLSKYGTYGNNSFSINTNEVSFVAMISKIKQILKS